MTLSGSTLRALWLPVLPLPADGQSLRRQWGLSYSSEHSPSALGLTKRHKNAGRLILNEKFLKIQRIYQKRQYPMIVKMWISG